MLITGLSGAGKSQAMATFEDAGYFCVDNLPPEMIGTWPSCSGTRAARWSGRPWPPTSRRVRTSTGSVPVSTTSRRRGVPYRILFLEAAEPVLLNRFKETRRRLHCRRRLVKAAIGWRRELLAPLRERADVRIDTSDSRSRACARVADKMLPHGKVGKLAVTFMTFGFKHGSPRDADPDLRRALPAEPRLRVGAAGLTGLDPR